MDSISNQADDNETTPSSLSQEDIDEAYSSALQLRCIDVFAHALSASMQLHLFDIIAQAGPHALLTASEITSQLPTKNPLAFSMIDRILRLLTCYSLLTCSLRNLDDFMVERRYGLSPAGHLFVSNKKGVSMAAFSSDGKCCWNKAWLELKDAILEGGNPFERAYGVPMYEKISSDRESVKGFNRAMDGISSYIMEKVLNRYNGFHGLTSLVDVGGGSGVALNFILQKHPSILGINFDMPHVVNDSPSYPGIKHVGGDMFLGIPSADAIMMKEVLHNWGDEECLKILKNCYDSLPNDGKVIVISHVMPEVLNPTSATKYVCQLDVMMFLFPGGKQRTQKEFMALGKASGFSGFQLICFVAYNAVAVMEFYK